MTHVLRKVSCPSCGAASDHVEGGAYLVCAHCQKIVGLREGMIFGEERAAVVRDSMRALIRPTDAEVRQTELSMAMASAEAVGDRAAWRAAMREYVLLLPVTRPALLPPELRTEAELIEHVDRATLAAELAIFDPALKAAAAAMDPTPIWQSADPVAGARAYLSSAVRYYEAIRVHPDYPPSEAARLDPMGMARDGLRAMLGGLASLLSPASIRAIYVEVLGATEAAGATRSCPHCLAPLAEGADRCRWCRSRISGEATDPWLAGLVASFEAVMSAVDDPGHLAALAASLPYGGAHGEGPLPSAADARRFLEAVVPHLPQDVLLTAIEALRPAYPRAPYAELAASIRARWEPTPAKVRAAPEVARFASVEAAAASPWVRQQLATWPHGRPEDRESRAAGLVSMALTPFHLGSAVSVEEMAAFVRAAEPELTPKELRAAIDGLLAAYGGSPRLVEALGGLREIVGT